MLVQENIYKNAGPLNDNDASRINEAGVRIFLKPSAHIKMSATTLREFNKEEKEERVSAS